MNKIYDFHLSPKCHLDQLNLKVGEIEPTFLLKKLISLRRLISNSDDLIIDPSAILVSGYWVVINAQSLKT